MHTRRRTKLSAVAALLFLCLMAAACGPRRIVRVPVSPEDIKRANVMAREGDLFFARRDFYASLIKYLEAGRLNPNSEYIYNRLGITYSQLKFYNEAAAAFERCIGLNPKYSYSYNNLGSVYFASNDKKRAEKYFKKAISLDKDVASFHVNLGTLYFQREMFEKGLEEWRLGISLDPDVLNKSGSVSLVAATEEGDAKEKNYFMARLYAAMGNAEQAVESLQQALDTGFSDLKAIENEPDFDPIRNDDRFIAFMKTASLLLKP